MTARSNVRVPFTTVPPFETAAKEHALNLSQFSTQELEKLLRINSKLAATNYLRYQDFCSDETPALPALLSYTGMVFKCINPKDFSEDDFRYAQEHLLIISGMRKSTCLSLLSCTDYCARWMPSRITGWKAM